MFAKQENSTEVVHKTFNMRLSEHHDNLSRLTKQMGDLSDR